MNIEAFENEWNILKAKWGDDYRAIVIVSKLSTKSRSVVMFYADDYETDDNYDPLLIKFSYKKLYIADISLNRIKELI